MREERDGGVRERGGRNGRDQRKKTEWGEGWRVCGDGDMF